MNTSSARDLISALVSQLGLADVTFSDDGSCGLLFEDDTNVTLEPDPEQTALLHMHTSVGTVPHEKRLAFFARLLLGNYLGKATGNAVLSLDEQGHTVLLHKSLPVENAGVEEAGEHLTQFVKSARDWAQMLDAAPTTSRSQGAGFDLGLANMIRI